jgi:hypothetical protein
MRDSAIPGGWPEHQPLTWARLARQAARTLGGLWDGQQFVAYRSDSATPPSWADAEPAPSSGDDPAGHISAPTEPAEGTTEAAGDVHEFEIGDVARSDETAEEPVDRPPLTVVSLRCVAALINLVDVVPEWASAAVRDLIARHLLPAVASMDVQRFSKKAQAELSEGADGKKLFPYAAATLTYALARAALIDDSEYKAENIDRLQLRADARQARSRVDAASELVIEQSTLICQRFAAAEREGDWLGGCVHPIVLYRLAGSLWLAARVFASAPPGEDHSELIKRLTDAQQDLATHVRRLTERLIALHELQPGEQGEHVALAFCAGALARPSTARRSYVMAACEAALQGQDATGRWVAERRAGDHSHPDGDGSLSLSTYDVADVLAESLLAAGTRDEQFRSRPPSRELVEGLLRAAQHADESIVELDVPRSASVREGWNSEHTFGQRRVEAEATAAVLDSLVGLRDLANEARRLEAMGTFDMASPRDEFWPEWLRWDSYKERSEPDSDLSILGYLDKEVVEKAVRDPLPWERTEGKGLLLFGPPGTTKTTIVRALAHGLRWPLVTLSPGIFIEEGLEAIEKQARSVFERLHALKRAVVLFDECDELFRERNPGQGEGSGQNRGIAAFMTASMLPKLQDLHDRGQVIFVVVTNYFETMDPAMKRIGRIDHIVGVPWPDPAQRENIIRTGLIATDEATNAAVEVLVKGTDGFIRGEILKAVESLQTQKLTSSAEARLAAKEAVDSLGEKTITGPQMTKFSEQASKYSVPHIRARLAKQ